MGLLCVVQVMSSGFCSVAEVQSLNTMKLKGITSSYASALNFVKSIAAVCLHLPACRFNCLGFLRAIALAAMGGAAITSVSIQACLTNIVESSTSWISWNWPPSGRPWAGPRQTEQPESPNPSRRLPCHHLQHPCHETSNPALTMDWWSSLGDQPLPSWSGPTGAKQDGGGSTRGCGLVGSMRLHRAVNLRDSGLVERLVVGEGLDVNEVEAAGNTPLHNAGEGGLVGVRAWSQGELRGNWGCTLRLSASGGVLVASHLAALWS